MSKIGVDIWVWKKIFPTPSLKSQTYDFRNFFAYDPEIEVSKNPAVSRAVSDPEMSKSGRENIYHPRHHLLQVHTTNYYSVYTGKCCLLKINSELIREMGSTTDQQKQHKFANSR